MATYWFRHKFLKPLDAIPYDAEGREVRGVHHHVGFSNLQRLYDAHGIVGDVDYREAFGDQRWEYAQASKISFAILAQ